MKFRMIWLGGILGCLAACSSNFSSDGFKSVKFDMDLAALKKLGFDCKEQDYSCSQSPSAPKETLFGKDASVSVETDKGKVQSIDVSIAMTVDDLIEQYKKEIGNPEKFTYDTFSGGQAERYYWLSKDGTAISVVKSIVTGPLAVKLPDSLQAYADTRSNAQYLGSAKTKEMVASTKGKKVVSGDM